MFFKKKENETESNFLVKICALLIHTAKIDENYTNSEEEIIKKTLLQLGSDENELNKTIKEAKIIEENSNQILEFTREVKNLAEEDKIKIIEALWSIIYSNKDADIYETNLMRRLAGLLYIDSKTMGDASEVSFPTAPSPPTVSTRRPDRPPSVAPYHRRPSSQRLSLHCGCSSSSWWTLLSGCPAASPGQRPM